MRADWPRIPLPVTFKAMETSAKLGADVGQLLDIEKPALGVILCEASWHGMLHLPIYSASVIFSDRFVQTGQQTVAGASCGGHGSTRESYASHP